MGLERTIPAGERTQTYALERSALGPVFLNITSKYSTTGLLYLRPTIPYVCYGHPDDIPAVSLFICYLVST